MKSAPVPDNEAERLAALKSYRVLDTDPEQGFDDLTAIAAEIAGMPIALVSLIDTDRQWFKSHHGLDATETPREIAFCAHAILDGHAFVIPDSSKDERFADNPLVINAPYVRSYAGMPLINPEGHALGTLCVIDHVPRALSPAQLKALERLGRQVTVQLELRRARDEAVKAAAAKSEFLATMSHEIRTPLNGVLGMTQLLLETALTDEQRDYATTVRSCGDHLLVVINDVLDFSKLEAGKVEFDAVPFDIHDLVFRAADLLRTTAKAKGVALDIECGLGTGTWRHGDPTRLRQIVLNLLSNALKFTAAGHVTATIEEIPQSVDVRVTVADTGIGIPSDQIPALFQRFSQADTSTTRRFGGTGLGLAITRRLVELMGGTVGVSSVPGVGSRFWFQVSLPPAATPVSEKPSSPCVNANSSVCGLRVLVAEDNLVNQKLLSRILERMGCVTTMVADGTAAVAEWNAKAFDVVLMDCQMPEMDGYEATRLIRTTSSRGAEVPIIALTASALDADREKCLLAGMSDFLSKPIVLTQLEAALQAAATALSRIPENHAADLPARLASK